MRKNLTRTMGGYKIREMIKRNRSKTRQVILTDEIRVDELAELFEVSRQTIYGWIKTGKLLSRQIRDVMEFYCERKLTTDEPSR